MKPPAMQRTLMIGCLVFLAGAMAWASEGRPPTLPERLAHAAQVVIGRLAEENGKPVLRVYEVLKGPEIQVIRDGLGHIEGDATEQDILYVKPPAGSYRGNYAAAHYVACGYATWGLAHMLKDPAAALADESPVNPSDAVLMLGTLFQSGRIRCREYPDLLVDLPIELPWAMDEVAEVTARLEVDDDYKTARLAATGGNPDPLVAAAIRDRPVKWEALPKEREQHLTIVIDGRKVRRVGTLDREEAVAFIRRQLRVPGAPGAPGAIEALSQMREPAAVPEAIGLLGNTPEETQRTVIRYLRAARDPAALAPLRALLHRSLRGPGASRQIAGWLCQALSFYQDPGLQEDLIAALNAGIEAAHYPLRATGDANTGDAILNRDAGPLSGTDLATLYWLVRRSNFAPQTWMRWDSSCHPTTEEEETRWREWWREHRPSFSMVRSAAEASADHAREHPAPPHPRRKIPSKMRWLMWTLGALAGLAAGVAAWWLRRRRGRRQERCART
jgi:hypothetical protein